MSTARVKKRLLDRLPAAGRALKELWECGCGIDGKCCERVFDSDDHVLEQELKYRALIYGLQLLEYLVNTMAAAPNGPPAPDSPRESQSPVPEGLQGELEQELFGLAGALYNLGTTVITDVSKDRDRPGAGKHVGMRVYVISFSFRFLLASAQY